MANILFIDQYAVLGGAQRILVDLATAFHQAGHGVTVLLPQAGEVSETLERSGVTTGAYLLPDLRAGRKGILERARFLASAQQSSRSIRDICAGQSFDFMYINGPRAMLAGVMAAGRLRLPVVAAVHLIHHGADRWLLSRCFANRQVKLVSFCSRYASERFPAAAKKGMILPNWVAPEFLDAPAPVRAEGIGLALGVLGRVSRNKGQRLFLESAVPLLPQHGDLRLLLAGGSDFEDPREESDLRQSVAQMGDRVFFLGKTDARAFLDTLDISVVPSIEPESFGLVAIESMARSLPVVATRLGGLQETVVDGVTGFLVDPEPGQMRQALTSLIENPDLRKSMGDAGRKRVESEFNPEILIPQAMHAILEAVA